jgi:hypothetical protein
MSLINDALKRARDAERQRSSPNNHTPLQPADNPYRPGPATRWLILGLVAIVLLLSGLSFHQWARQPNSAPLAQIPPSIPSQPPLSSKLPQLPKNSPTQAAAGDAPSLETQNSSIETSSPLNVETSPTPHSVPEPDPQESSPVGTTVPPVPPEFQITPELPPATSSEPEPVSEPTSPPEFRLQSIIFRVQKPTAMINGELLQHGDAIGEARVIDIQRDAVTLTWRDSNVVLRLPRF